MLFSDAGNTAADAPIFFGTPGMTCTWVGSGTTKFPGYTAIRNLVGGKWIEEWWSAEPAPTGPGHSAGAAPGVHKSLIHILGEVPKGYDDCDVNPKAATTGGTVDTAAIVTGVLQGLAANPQSPVTQADVDRIITAINATPDEIRQEFVDHPLH
jgi:hypothetical protein